MPIYEYHCSACGADFEKLVFGSKNGIVCERCGSDRTEKLMSRFGMGKSSGSGSDTGSSGSSGCGGCSSSSCAGCH